LENLKIKLWDLKEYSNRERKDIPISEDTAKRLVHFLKDRLSNQGRLSGNITLLDGEGNIIKDGNFG